MRSFNALVLIVIALAACRTDSSAHRREPITKGIETAAQTFPPAYSKAVMMREPPVKHAEGVADVVIHVPANFDPAQKLNLVIVYHGSGTCAAQMGLAGQVQCKPDAPLEWGAALASRHDDAETNSIFILPQFNLWGGGTPGKLTTDGYFTKMVREVVEELLTPAIGPKQLDDIESITLIAHSAGVVPLDVTLEKAGALESKIRAVFSIDSMFAASVAPYINWLKRGQPGTRKFVATYGNWGSNQSSSRAIAQAAKSFGLRTVVDPSTPFAETISKHDVVVKLWKLEHAWMVPITFSKFLSGIGLPPRKNVIAREALGGSPPEQLPFNAEVRGVFASAGPRLRTGGLYADYWLNVPAGSPVQVRAIGERSETEPCCQLDTTLEVYEGDRKIVENDDVDATFASGIDLPSATAERRFRVRVTTYGSGEKRGGYTVSARSGEANR